VIQFPELQDALVDAAHRRRAPRRARRLVRAAVPVAAAAAALAAVFWAAGAPDDEQPVQPAATPNALESTLAVFRRPATSADALPRGVVSTSQSPRLDPERVRLVFERGERRGYVVAATIDGRPNTCLYVFRGEQEEGASCGDVTPRGPGSVMYSVSAPPLAVAAVAADGVDELELRFPDGSRERHRFADNGLYVPLDEAPVAASWIDPDGRTQQNEFPVIEADPPGASTCAALDPLPPDAEARAREAALAAAPRLYPGTRDPRVEDVRSAPADAGGCGEQTRDRALVVALRLDPGIESASLSQGRLLVGQVGGRMVVVQQLH
jgi:hypothetical protein